MSTPFESTPKWFDANFYLASKLALLQATDPKGAWTHEKMVTVFVEGGFQNPYDHYMMYGVNEGLNPNKYFNAKEYLTAKTAQLGSTWTEEMVAQTMQDAGLTLVEHYIRFGASESLNPSKSFDQHKYFEAKLEQLLTTDPKGEWTIEKVQAAFKTAGITPLEHFLVYGVKEGLDDPRYDYAEGGAPIPRPGNAIALTTGVDVVSPTASGAFQTSSRDDVISAVTASATAKNTLNSADVIDGGAGRDTLHVTMQGNFAGFTDGAGVSNVETIALGSAGGYTFDAKGVVAAERYTMHIADGKTTTLKNVDTTSTTMVFSAGKGATLNVQHTEAALSGREDMVAVHLNAVGDSAGSASLKVGDATGNRVESLRLVSDGTENFVNVTSKHETLAVGGSGDLAVTDSAGGLKTFDASAAIGKVNATLRNSVDTLNTINGGAGDDTVTLTGLAAGAECNGGDGNDTLKFAGFTAPLSLKPQTSGFETIAFASTGQDLRPHTIDLSGSTGLATLRYEGGTPDAGAESRAVFDVKNADLSEFTFTLKNLTDTYDSTWWNDNGATSNLVYGGTGALNLVLDAEGGTAAAGNLLVTASRVTSLHVSNANAQTVLQVRSEARAAETLHMDTSQGRGIIMHTDAGGMPALQNVVLTGDGEAVFIASGSERALTHIDASGLTGALMLNLLLIDAKADGTGVDILMGSGGTAGRDIADKGIMGSMGADTIRLHSAAAEKVELAWQSGKDQLFNFGSEDHLTFRTMAAPIYTTTLTGAFCVSGGGISAVNGLGAEVSGISSWETAPATEVEQAIVRVFTQATGVTLNMETGKNAFFAFDNGTDVGVIRAKVKDGGFSGSATDVTSGTFQSIELVGILKDVDLDVLSATTFL